MSQAAFVCSQALWQQGHGEAHPLKPVRLRRTHRLLQAYGAFDAQTSRLHEPRRATDEELALFHTPEYIDAVRRLSRSEADISARRFNFGPGDNPVWEGMYETEALKVGSALVATDLLLKEEIETVFSFSGGLHHAGPAQASGFCVFNDAAVAIHHLLREGLRVAYVDIDAHHGDGVQDAFYDTDQVLTVSLHQSGRTLFPGTGFVNETGQGDGEGYAANVPLPPHTDDEGYLWVFRQVVPALVEQFAPGVLVTQLGVDTHYRDPLTHLALTTAGHEQLFRAFAEMGLPWLALGGGGYDVTVVPRSWTLAYGVMTGQDFPEELPEAYAETFEGGTLHDQEDAPLQGYQRRRARQYVETQIERLRELLAPYWSL